MRRFTGFLATSLLVLCWLLLPAYCDQLPASKPEEVGISSQGLDQLDAYVQKIVDGKELSGAVLMMARHGKVAHQKAIGLMNLEAKKPMRADAVFRIASMTKPVTSVGIMILCDDGRLALDDPVSRYLPEFKQPRVLVTRQPLKTIPAKREITIRDLLRHTAGLTYVWNPERGPLYREAGIICGLTPEKVTLEGNIKRLAKMPLLFSPGDKWEYGLSTDVLGRVVEVVSGMSLDEFCQKRIFLPLGMKDTHFQLPKEKYHRLPIVYIRDGKGPMRPLLDGKQEIAMGTLPYAADFPYQGKSRYLSGGAGLCATASDYLRFCQMLLNGGQLDGKRLLREDTVRAMRSNQVGNLSTGPAGQKFGLGFAVVEKAEDQDKQLVGCYAWGGFFGTLFWIVPKEDWILVVMLQQVGGPEPSRRWPNELVRLAAASVGETRRIMISKDHLNQFPAGWKADHTGKAGAGAWKVVAEETAPSKTGQVLAQTGESPGPVFNLCVAADTSFQDMEVSVMFKANRGKKDQGGGIVWRYRDAHNYYIARFNPLEENYRLYKVVAGKRIQLATREDVAVPAGEWHRLTVKMTGDQIECCLDGKKLLEAKDHTFPKAGKVGLWTKADAQTSFDQFEIIPLNQPLSQAMLVEPGILQAHLHQPGLRLLDTRPKAEYAKGQIPGAIWVDVKRWQELGSKEGGLHDAPAWGKEVGGIGIEEESAVIVYGSALPDTARIWWTLKYLGLKKVSILNGGWPLWIKEKRLTDTISPTVKAVKFQPKFQADRLEEADSLKKALGTGTITLVDARSRKEFTGQEVRGKRGGHIPGAKHLEWKDLLAADGRFHSPEQLRGLFQQRGIHPEKTAVTC